MASADGLVKDERPSIDAPAKRHVVHCPLAGRWENVRQGLGQMLHHAVLDQDYPLVQGIVLVSAAVYILIGAGAAGNAMRVNLSRGHGLE